MLWDSNKRTRYLRCELYHASKSALGCAISSILVTVGYPTLHNWQSNRFKYIQSNRVYWTTGSMIHVSLTGHGHNSIKNTIKLQVLYEVIKLGRSKIHKSPKHHFLPEPAIRFQFPTYTLAVTRKEILKIYRYRLGIAMTNGPRELSRHCTQEQKQFEDMPLGQKDGLEAGF